MICDVCANHDYNRYGGYCKKASQTYEPGYSPVYHPTCVYDPKLSQLFQTKEPDSQEAYIFTMFRLAEKRATELEYENRQLRERLTKI